ncbi:SDR family NAD(P)-dependent oxidoreductase [Pseudalkalibacillus hwajinpoensis]|uniref:SDR family NAD(P)-dependent oxidoreductase n=1 Tax=Guptibacillus hwajinpoensis TaxID=208199 RepID=A0A4U1MDW3_9BACL|nr:SDR family NAD(P)-dependent oxidoreductase [Pseudalkalibacillus hwajinpoensis]TKD68336.1 SDR family NAD(P)-dependent oxidoreductase [Pseudalkalibacillus hwajinpoensis]
MKTILITGAGSGLGAELAKQWGNEDNHIVLVGRTKQKLEGVQRSIKNGSSSIYTCDISDSKQVAELMEALEKNETVVDLLVNNAGVGAFGALEEIPIEDIHHVLDTNVKGTIFLTQALLKTLKKGGGRVMNIISTAGLKGKNHESVYVASKYAVRGFTESLWKELEDTNASATAVYMGGMDTPFWSDTDHVKDTSRLKSPSEKAKQIIQLDEGQKEIFIDR